MHPNLNGLFSFAPLVKIGPPIRHCMKRIRHKKPIQYPISRSKHVVSRLKPLK